LRNIFKHALCLLYETFYVTVSFSYYYYASVSVFQIVKVLCKPLILNLLNVQLLDKGGGIRRSELDKLFNYMYSTAPRPPSPDAADTTPLVSLLLLLMALAHVKVFLLQNSSFSVLFGNTVLPAGADLTKALYLPADTNLSYDDCYMLYYVPELSTAIRTVVVTCELVLVKLD